jgi:hypothetical protein
VEVSREGVVFTLLSGSAKSIKVYGAVYELEGVLKVKEGNLDREKTCW